MSDWEYRVYWRTGLACPDPMFGYRQQQEQLIGDAQHDNTEAIRRLMEGAAQRVLTREQGAEQARLMRNAQPALRPPEPSEEIRAVLVSEALIASDDGAAFYVVLEYLAWLFMLTTFAAAWHGLFQ